MIIVFPVFPYDNSCHEAYRDSEHFTLDDTKLKALVKGEDRGGVGREEAKAKKLPPCPRPWMISVIV
jgi:hypothetical protein